jgi:hypothetical protein
MEQTRTLTCLECGSSFEWTIRKGRPPVVCGVQCKTARRKRQFRSADDTKVTRTRVERAQRPPTATTCQRCGAPFNRGQYRKYCGPECAIASKRELSLKRSLAFLGRVRESDATCAVDGCTKPPTHAYGLCGMHYFRKRTRGDVGGAENERVKGVRNKWKNGTGYIIDGETGRLDHRIVMEQMLGRPLEPFENVHHINGRRDDNRLENLELWVT